MARRAQQRAQRNALSHCHVALVVYRSQQNALIFFIKSPAPHSCGGQNLIWFQFDFKIELMVPEPSEWEREWKQQQCLVSVPGRGGHGTALILANWDDCQLFFLLSMAGHGAAVVNIFPQNRARLVIMRRQSRWHGKSVFFCVLTVGWWFSTMRSCAAFAPDHFW